MAVAVAVAVAVVDPRRRHVPLEANFIRRALRLVLPWLRRLRPPAPSCLPARAEGGTEVKRS